MKNQSNIKERKPVWLALSELYLDTEIQEHTFQYLAKQFKESPFSLSEIKNINKYEVFPVLSENLLSPTGVWNGFDEYFLYGKIKQQSELSIFKKMFINLYYRFFKKQFDAYWQKIEKYYY